MARTSEVEAALTLPASARGPALAQLAEDQWFDRKSSRIGAPALANALVAMANAEGGTLVVGISDGRVEGIGSDAGRLNDWRQASMDFTVPPVPVKTQAIDCLNERGESDALLVIEVQPSDHVHSNRRDEVFLRVGDENRLLRFEQRQELTYDKGQASFEATAVPRFSFARLDESLVAAYAEAVGHPDARRLLVARGLLLPRGEVTVGAFLLFSPEPQARYPEANIRVLRYRGTERGTGARQQLLDDRRFDGPIPTMLDAARAAVIELLPTRRALGRGAKFEQTPLVPEAAWFEAIVNGVVHRSYSMAGDHIRVDIFDDRVEIESPGRFPGVVDGSDPLSMSRFARNPRIARACAELRYGQELGEGIRRMYEEMRLARLPDPMYRQTSGSVRVTLLGTPASPIELTERGRQLVRILRAGGLLSTGELVGASGWSRPTVLGELRKLRDAGVVAWDGSSRNDPMALWHLL